MKQTIYDIWIYTVDLCDAAPPRRWAVKGQRPYICGLHSIYVYIYIYIDSYIKCMYIHKFIYMYYYKTHLLTELVT